MVRENIRQRLRQRPNSNDIPTNTLEVCAIPFGRNYFYPLTATNTPPPPPFDDSSETTNDHRSDCDESDICTSTSIPLPWNHDEYKNNQQPLLPRSATCSSQSTIIVSPIDGKVYQTGTMHGNIYTNWKHIVIPLPLKCVQVSAGRHYCLARLEGGNAVLSWGAGHFGQLGVVITNSAAQSTKKTSRNRQNKAASISSDEDDDDEDDDEDTSNGNSSVRTSPSIKCISFTAQPVLIERLLPSVTGSPIQSIAAGDWHALALTESGHVWSWGSNRSLQCGIPSRKDTSTSSPSTTGSLALPLPIPGLPPMKQIAAGRAHSCALTAGSGKVYCWGSSHTGQCGTGTTLRRSVKGLLPTPVQGLPSSLEMIQIDAAGDHCISLSKAGRVFTWGDGRQCQLGFSIATSTSKCISLQDLYSNKPRLVADLDFVAVAASHASHSDHQHNNTIDGNGTPVLSAAQLLARTPKITSVYASETGSAAISSSGHVYCWGSNDVGQLGIPTPKNIPLEISTDSSMPDHYTNTSQPHLPSHPVSARHLHMQTFDSNHNVILPIRLAWIDTYFIQSLIMGPNHMFCFGTERNTEAKSLMIGQTLHEAQLKYEQKVLGPGQTTVNPYGKGILHKPIATGVLESSILTDMAESHVPLDSTEVSGSNGATDEGNLIDKTDENVNSDIEDRTNLASNTGSTGVVSPHGTTSSTSSSPVTASFTNPVQEQTDHHDPSGSSIVSNDQTINAAPDVSNATSTHNTTIDIMKNSSKASQLQQYSSNNIMMNEVKSERRDRVVRRRFSFGLFTRRSSSQPQQPRRQIGRHKSMNVNDKDNNEPSTGTV